MSYSTNSGKDRDAALPQPQPTWVRWRVVALLLAFSFMSWFNRVSMSVAYDEQIKEQYGISEEAMGAVYSALLFAYMVFMTPGGWFADRRGAWRALVLMGFGSALFVALTGAVGLGGFSTATVLALFFVVRTAMGVCTAPIYPASGRIIAHWLPAGQRAGVNGMVMAAALVGIASTFVGFGTLMDWFGWPAAFLIAGAVTAVLALMWTGYATDRPEQHPAVNPDELHWIWSGESVPPEPEDARVSEPAKAKPAGAPVPGGALWRDRSLILLTLSYAAVGYFEYLFYFWMHYYFEQVLRLGKDDSRLYTTVLNLAMAVGMVLGGALSDRLVRSWGRRPGRAAVAAGGMLLGAALLCLGIVAETPAWIVTWFALALAAVGATEGPFWATAIELGGRHGATSAGIFNTGGNAGGVVAPILTPLVSRHFGWLWGIAIGSLVCLVGASLWVGINPEDRGSGQAPTT
jgi:MFS transporter, ACS family, D-galactonate transporter